MNDNKPLSLSSGAAVTALAPQIEQLDDLIVRIADGDAEVIDLIAAMAPIVCGDLPIASDQALAMTMALNQIEHKAQQEDQLHLMVNNQSAPALLLSEAGIIVALNEAAWQHFDAVIGDGYPSLGVSKQDFITMGQRLMESATSTLIKVYQAGSGKGQVPMLMLTSYHHSLQVFMLTALQHTWPESMDKALADMFGLSASERDVLALLAQGVVAEQIAQKRCRAVGTVRQQIKAIMAKLGANNQLQVATLAAAASQAISQDHRTGDQLRQLALDTLSLAHFQRKGRRVGWRRFGRLGGKKVVLMHGPFFGAGGYSKERHVAAECGLDVFALERPGYGRTEGPASISSLMQEMVDDTLALMDAHGIAQATFFCQENGLMPALLLANQAPERVANIVGISASPPYRTLAQTNAMPSKQRLFVWAAQNAQWMIRLLIRLGMVQLRKLGPERWLDAAFSEVAEDMAVIYRPEHRDGNMASYSLNIQQNGRGLELDLIMSGIEWEHLVRAVPCPVSLLHGRTNQTTPAQFMSAFTKLNPAIEIDWVEDAGQTLLLSHTKQVYIYLAERIPYQA